MKQNAQVIAQHGKRADGIVTQYRPPQARAAGHTAVPFPTLPDGPAKPDGSAQPHFDQDTSANGD